MRNLLLSALLVTGAVFSQVPTDPDQIKGTGAAITSYAADPSITPDPLPAPVGQSSPSPAREIIHHVGNYLSQLSGYMATVSRDLAAQQNQSLYTRQLSGYTAGIANDCKTESKRLADATGEQWIPHDYTPTYRQPVQQAQQPVMQDRWPQYPGGGNCGFGSTYANGFRGGCTSCGS